MRTLLNHASRSLIPLLAAALAAAVPAQSPLATPFNGTLGSRAVFFDLTVHPANGVTLAALELHCSAPAGTPVTVSVHTIVGSYLDCTDDQSLWTPGASGSFVSAGPGQMSFACLGTGLHLGANTYGIAVITAGSQQTQTVAVTCTSNTLPGVCANSLFTNGDVTLAAGASQVSPFGTFVAHRRVWNGRIHYGLGSFTSACTEKQIVGQGCFASTYELYADAALAQQALEGRALRFQPSGANYRVSWSLGSYVPPGPAAVPVFANPTDDGEQVVTPSQPLPTPQGLQAQLRVHSNGLLAWGPGPSTFPGTLSWAPSADAFLNGDNSGIYAWHDFNENEPGSGRIVSEERFVAGSPVLFVTWHGVENYAVVTPFPNPSTIQFQLELATGTVTIVWHDVDADTSSTFGTAHLVGCTPGGPSADPGAVDFDAVLPLVTAATDAGVRLTGNTPHVGAAWVLASQHVGPAAPLAFQFFGTAPIVPSLDLGFLGAPGCRAYQSADLGAFAFPVTAGAGQFTVAVPANGALCGIVLHTQSVALTSDNALHLAMSNGLWGRVGY